MNYIAVLEKEPGRDFGVFFPDFPGCVTAAETIEDAKKQAAEAIALHFDGMKADCAPLPWPSSFDDIASIYHGDRYSLFLVQIIKI